MAASAPCTRRGLVVTVSVNCFAAVAAVTKKGTGRPAMVVTAAECAPLRAQAVIHCFADVCLVEIPEEQLVEGINDIEDCA